MIKIFQVIVFVLFTIHVYSQKTEPEIRFQDATLIEFQNKLLEYNIVLEGKRFNKYGMLLGNNHCKCLGNFDDYLVSVKSTHLVFPEGGKRIVYLLLYRDSIASAKKISIINSLMDYHKESHFNIVFACFKAQSFFRYKNILINVYHLNKSEKDILKEIFNTELIRLNY